MAGNRALALGAIEKYKNAPLGHFVNGASLPGEGAAFDVLEPGTGEVLGQACDASEAQLEAAVAAGH